MIDFLMRLKADLDKSTDMPTFYNLPELSVPEPFIVLGTSNNDGTPSPKAGKEVQRLSLQVDLFLPLENGRLYAERDTQAVKRVIQRQSEVTTITSRTLIDKSTSRDIYHIVLDVTAFL